MTTKAKWTTEQKQAWKEEKQAEQKQLLADALTELARQDVWSNFVKFGRTNLAKYSWHNSILIFIQKQEATLVKGRKTWQKEGVTVKDDAKAIKIFAPVFVPMRNEDGSPMYDENGKQLKRLGFFKVVTVFDVSDTDAPVSENPREMQKLTGDQMQEFIPALESFGMEIGAGVRYFHNESHQFPKDSMHVPTLSQGYYDPELSEIQVNIDLDANDMVHTLVHCLAWAYGAKQTELATETAEILSESAAVMTLGMLGFDIRDVAVPYIVGWGGDTKTLEKYAGLVNEISTKLTEAMGL